MKFTLGTTIIELDSPAQYPADYVPTLSQAKEKSASGVTHVEDFKVKTSVRIFVFEDMSTADYQKLVNFFISDAEGMLNPFTLTDDYGGEEVVRFGTPSLPFKNTQYNLWSGSITVEGIS